jgi:hypothetical protein
LLGIGHEQSEQYRKWIAKGYSGIKPGWCRISLHYVMDDIEIEYIMDAVEFVADHGHLFLAQYIFDLHSGAWSHKRDCVCLEPFSLQAALECCGPTPTALSVAERAHRYAAFMRAARQLATALSGQAESPELIMDAELEPLKFFSLPQACISPQ